MDLSKSLQFVIHSSCEPPAVMILYTSLNCGGILKSAFNYFTIQEVSNHPTGFYSLEMSQLRNFVWKQKIEYNYCQPLITHHKSVFWELIMRRGSCDLLF